MRTIRRHATLRRASWRRTQARLANLETRSRETEIAQARADLADLVATRDRIAKDLARNEELLKHRRCQPARPWINSVPTSRPPPRAPKPPMRKLEQMMSPTGRQYEIAAQSAPWWSRRARRWHKPSGRSTSAMSSRRSPHWSPTPMRAWRDHQCRRSRRRTAAAAEYPGALLRAGDRARHAASGDQLSDRLRRLRARPDRQHHVHRTAAGIHAAGDLQRNQPRKAGVSDRGTSVASASDPAQAGPAGGCPADGAQPAHDYCQVRSTSEVQMHSLRPIRRGSGGRGGGETHLRMPHPMPT